MTNINMTTANNITYVWVETEVQLTGRSAIKQIKTTKATIEDKLVEIQPTDQDGPTWKKWVRESDLYRVIPQK